MTDRATFDQHVARLRLAIVFEGGPLLLNTYAVVLNPDGPHATDALRFADWLSDGEGRGIIESYRIGGKAPAFHVWPDGRPRALPNDLPR